MSGIIPLPDLPPLPARREAYRKARLERQQLLDEGYMELPTSYSSDNRSEAERVFRALDGITYPDPVLLFIPPNPDANINALDHGSYRILRRHRFGVRPATKGASQ